MLSEELLAEAAWVRRLAQALVGDGGAEDLTQEAWEVALRRPRERDSRPVRPWLRTAVRNLAAMRARAAGRRERREHVAATAATGLEVPTPEAVVARLELSRQLATLVLALDESYRQAVMLRYYEGMSAVEIGRRLGVPAAT